MGRDKVLGFFIAFTLQETDTHQLFDDTGSGRRGSQTFTLHLVRHFICTGSFHARKQRVLSVVLRRGSFTLFDLAGRYRQLVTNRNRRKFFFLFVRFCRRLFSLQSFPSHLQHGFSLCGESCVAAVQLDHCLCEAVSITDCTEKAGRYQLQNCKFTFGEFTQIAFLQFSGGNDSVVVSDLFVVDDLCCIDGNTLNTIHGESVEYHVHKIRQHGRHVLSQKSAVSTRVSD